MQDINSKCWISTLGIAETPDSRNQGNTPEGRKQIPSYTENSMNEPIRVRWGHKAKPYKQIEARRLDQAHSHSNNQFPGQGLSWKRTYIHTQPQLPQQPKTLPRYSQTRDKNPHQFHPQDRPITYIDMLLQLQNTLLAFTFSLIASSLASPLPDSSLQPRQLAPGSVIGTPCSALGQSICSADGTSIVSYLMSQHQRSPKPLTKWKQLECGGIWYWVEPPPGLPSTDNFCGTYCKFLFPPVACVVVIGQTDNVLTWVPIAGPSGAVGTYRICGVTGKPQIASGCPVTNDGPCA